MNNSKNIMQDSFTKTIYSKFRELKQFNEQNHNALSSNENFVYYFSYHLP